MSPLTGLKSFFDFAPWVGTHGYTMSPLAGLKGSFLISKRRLAPTATLWPQRDRGIRESSLALKGPRRVAVGVSPRYVTRRYSS